MIICVKTRFGRIHIVNWTTSRGVHHTICGKSFSNKRHVETFAADNTFSGICSNCYIWQVDYDLESANNEPRDIKLDPVISNSIHIYTGVQGGWAGPQDKFEDMLDRRNWPKKSRMRRKFPNEETIHTKRYKIYESFGKNKRK